ncbi:MAG: hypothetical protein HYR51_17055 [Candidatus Rokubacteria bacterium]|nr:hypothetical protein [Candidatus Rokubacteria bacterium]
MRAFAVRRDVLSIGNELRFLAWAGVMLVATGAGIVVRKRFDDIGPLTVAAVIGAAALGCYAWAAVKPSAPLAEYVVLLGALLVSADVGFIEHQWRLLGPEWPRHFLFLAAAHAAAAYYFDSRAVLSLSIAALAAWFGIERRPPRGVDLAVRSFACAAVVGLWRRANRNPAFTEVLEHFAANLAFWGALSLTFSRDARWIGAAVAVVFAAAAIAYGLRSRRELFVIYGYVYGAIAVDAAVLSHLHDTASVLYMLGSTVAVIVAMIVTHFRLRA